MQRGRGGGTFAGARGVLAGRGEGPAVRAGIRPYREGSAEGRVGDAVLPSRAAGGPAAGRRARLDLDRASQEELEGLPGVGPVIAERILTLRQELGRFRSLEELRSVRGIGPAMIERIRSIGMIGR